MENYEPDYDYIDAEWLSICEEIEEERERDFQHREGNICGGENYARRI